MVVTVIKNPLIRPAMSFFGGNRGIAAVLGSSSQNSDTWLLTTMVSLLGSPYGSNYGTPSKWLFLAYKWGLPVTTPREN